MSVKVRVQPVSRVGISPLVEMAEQLRIALPGWSDARVSSNRPNIPSDLAEDLAHLAHHDGDGFVTASLDNEVVGFATSFVRSRHLTISQLWMLPGENLIPAAEALLRRAINFGDRAGVQDMAANVLAGSELEGVCFRFGLRPRFPVYRMTLQPDQAQRLGQELIKLLPASETTADLLERRVGAAELERIDRLARGFSRPMDHEYWINERRLRAVAVRDGRRIAAYAFGGPGRCGPVVGLTGDAALAALGWALQLASGETERVELLVPAPFEAAVEHLLDAGARCAATSQWMTRSGALGMDRSILASTSLP